MKTTSLANDPEVRKMALAGAQHYLKGLYKMVWADATVGIEPTPRQRNLSPEARERISAAQRKRWAKARRQNSAGRTKKGA